MAGMTTMPWNDWTVDDLDALPDDGFRYELVDGAYVEQASVSGAQEYTALLPFPVSVVPELLLR